MSGGSTTHESEFRFELSSYAMFADKAQLKD